MSEIIELLKTLDYSPLEISLKTGITAAVLAFFTAIFAANAVMRTSNKAAEFIDGILTLPMVLPPTVSGFILLMIFSKRRPVGMLLYEKFGISAVQSWLGCVIAAFVISFPLMYRNARAAFEQVDTDMIYAGRTLGMSEKSIFFKVILPNSRHTLAAGAILAFTRAMGEYGATSMLAGNIPHKTTTVAQKTAMVLQDGNYKTAAVWVVIMLVISFIAVTALSIAAKGKSKRKKW
ncbi:MAG: molybdate ABC transporter permease subunit [Firmicutes bacterium]|nr:molybdate ABC transporter permease subunit [Bacillota bacterium]MBQ9604017.1 molybdate ABC transporter permease subunit [Bacillota bacterium]